MSDADPRIEAFFSNATRWGEELRALRAILRDCPVAETFKWRAPCYTAEGGNVATLWGLKDGGALSFFKGVLLTDPAGLLTAPGEHSRAVRLVRFTSTAEIARRAGLLKDYVLEAVELEKAGLKVNLRDDDLAYPDELIDRLDDDAALREAFEALTPGRRRGYVLHFSQPKQSKTRTSRIEKCAPRIFAGKGLHDR